MTTVKAAQWVESGHRSASGADVSNLLILIVDHSRVGRFDHDSAGESAASKHLHTTHVPPGEALEKLTFVKITDDNARHAISDDRVANLDRLTR